MSYYRFMRSSYRVFPLALLFLTALHPTPIHRQLPLRKFAPKE